ncbi:MAG TPA: IclR family transcriptional regulator [Pseudonocardiaceae bacterium]
MTTGVQSVERGFHLLELLADAGGELTLSDLATASGLAPATIHRLLGTLAAGGYVRQQPSRKYALGPRLIRLGEAAGQALGGWVRPYLARLTRAVGETSNMAILDGLQVVYVAQVPSPHPMRMFTEVGRRVDVHCTAVGKAILTQFPAEDVDHLLANLDMRPQTERTITDPDTFRAELHTTAARGYAVDDGEQEIGVRCVAVAVPHAPTGTAISISGPDARMSALDPVTVVPLMREIAQILSGQLSASVEV